MSLCLRRRRLRAMEEGVPERIHAPDLTSATAWLNVDRPIGIRELRGHVVILDFWTYCCVNCMHVLPILRDLEERHANDPVVVIGVHSAKFDAEKDAQRIEAAMQRYGVSHPVAVDSDMRIWSEYAVRSWPTLVIIRPDGTLAAVAPGEPEPAMLEASVAAELERGRREGTLARTPFHPRGAGRAAVSTLSHPGKVAATSHGRIVVSDSGHHRVLVLGPDGAVQDTVGSGLRGAREGPFAEAALDDPQGIALDGDSLYIADARAHSIFVADLATRELTRLAGTLELGRTPLLEKGIAKQTALRSPWDLALRDHELYVALAGSHQIAMLDLREGTIEPVVGNGREALIDGPAKEAALAQPSGLSLQGDVLYVADSESSGVRAIHLRSRRVYTLAGGPGLFDFGDEIGPIRPGMLQHPLAVAATASSGLLVADTYNDKIKRFSPDGLRLESFFTGAIDSKLSQPAGLAVLPSGEILVADTNNHRIVKLSPSGEKAYELTIRNAPTPRYGAAEKPSDVAASKENAVGWFTAIVPSPAGIGFRPGRARLVLDVAAPEGFEIAAGAPWSLALEISRRSDLVGVQPEFSRGESRGGKTERIEIGVSAQHENDVDSELLVQLRTVVCDAVDHAACYPVKNSFRVPLRLLEDGQEEVRVALPVEVAR
ncbi:MAG: redoxin domain-containing protein [Deltaproteobacteria bacterium]|nr:MAG: redoxin domain-containing protein [Deltaproteobacteria bacterium]TMB33267.1 MAG: redoxin domain-containing protein [Deltaproteobacteria bacterium]